MTVKELIDVLMDMPADAEVLIHEPLRGAPMNPRLKTIYSVGQEDHQGDVNPDGPVYIVT